MDPNVGPYTPYTLWDLDQSFYLHNFVVSSLAIPDTEGKVVDAESNITYNQKLFSSLDGVSKEDLLARIGITEVDILICANGPPTLRNEEALSEGFGECGYTPQGDRHVSQNITNQTEHFQELASWFLHFIVGCFVDRVVVSTIWRRRNPTRCFGPRGPGCWRRRKAQIPYLPS